MELWGGCEHCPVGFLTNLWGSLSISTHKDVHQPFYQLRGIEELSRFISLSSSNRQMFLLSCHSNKVAVDVCVPAPFACAPSLPPPQAPNWSVSSSLRSLSASHWPLFFLDVGPPSVCVCVCVTHSPNGKDLEHSNEEHLKSVFPQRYYITRCGVEKLCCKVWDFAETWG